MIEFVRKTLALLLCVWVLGCQAADQKVTMKNLDQFKECLSSELVPGIPKSHVQDHLTALDLEYSYVEREKTFYAIVPKVGRYRIIYETSLLIRIKLDEEDKVKNIEYELEHTGL
ncbi:hypothetical protein CWE08_11900 [Aliidiomarina iranensis]|uniref:Lipoprotein n=1 Tax=Aliidiomarina iranensis TaxID=1434071 RepID=A0A432VPY2_9GAMM|nr:hypothetical protein [Aliidiomarina iranensis]RUO18182.1 hypothetical protein CWE08_11900 [Aliidiomarina iranensis]